MASNETVPTNQILENEDKEIIIKKISSIIRDNYVYPDIGEKIGDQVIKALNSGSFSNPTTNEEFAKAVLDTMEEIVVDKHNRVLSRGPKTEKFFEMAERMETMMSEMRKQEGNGEEEISSGPVRRIIKRGGVQPSEQTRGPVRRIVRQGGPQGAPTQAPGESQGGPTRVEIRGMTPGNPDSFTSGIEKVEILVNNTGYLKINSFESTQSPDKQNIIDSLTHLSSTDNLIIDLRDCRGGDGSMVTFLQGFLFGVEENETIVLTETYMRPYDDTMQSIPQPWTYSPTFRDKPVYLLVSASTGSAAEAFTFGFKNHERGTIIGKTTGGAGHPTSFHKVHEDILFMCSIGRSYDPKTGKGWERVGIDPHIDIETDQALDKAVDLINNQ